MSPVRPYRSWTAFTIIELVVVMSILMVLGTIGVMSFGSYIQNANDAKRVGDIALIRSNLAGYHRLHSDLYPIPQISTKIMTGSQLVAYQAFFDGFLTSLVGITKVPTDPKANTPYLYSVSADGTSYQVAATLENGSNMVSYSPTYHVYADSTNTNAAVAIVQGTFVSPNKNILPGLVYVTDSGSAFTP